MSVFVFSNREEDGTINTLTFSAETLNDVIDHFKDFLRGCTFSESLIEEIGRDERVGGQYGN